MLVALRHPQSIDCGSVGSAQIIGFDASPFRPPEVLFGNHRQELEPASNGLCHRRDSFDDLHFIDSTGSKVGLQECVFTSCVQFVVLVALAGQGMVTVPRKSHYRPAVVLLSRPRHRKVTGGCNRILWCLPLSPRGEGGGEGSKTQAPQRIWLDPTVLIAINSA